MQVGNHLSVVDRPQRRRTHSLMQLVLGLEQTGRICEDVLRVVFGEQANDGQARGLRLGRVSAALVRSDRELLRGPPGTEPVRLRTRAADRTRWVRAPADPFRAAA